MKLSFFRNGSLFLSVLLLAGTAAAESNAPDDYAHTRALYRKAAESFTAGDYAEARRLLLEAWQLKRSYDIAASLGEAQLKLGQYSEAAEYLNFSIQNFPPLESQQVLDKLRGELESAKRRIGALRVKMEETGVDVRVDGRLVGKTPLSSPVFVPPGEHIVVATQDDRTASKKFTLRAGEEQPAVLTLGSHAPAAPAPSATAADNPESKSVVPVVVGGALFAAGLGVGLGFHFAANSAEDRAKAAGSRLSPNACGSSAPPPDCATLATSAREKDRDANWSTAGFVTAGVALVAVPLYWFLWPDSSKEQVGELPRRIRVGGSFGPGGSSVSVTGRF